MKNSFAVLFTFTTFAVNAQVSIVNNDNLVDKRSVLIHFENHTNKGIILPYVRKIPTTPTLGTLLLDASNPLASRVKFYNGSWIDLSGQDADITNHLKHQPNIDETIEPKNAKVIIGATTTTADGVLVLESTTKSMILPIVDDVQNIPDPSPGMMVYINKINAKRLAVFNGSKWSFWGP